MRIRFAFLLTALSVLALAAPAWANQLSADVQLNQTVKVQGTVLPPGTYRVIASDLNNRVMFMRDRRVVAEFPARWINLEQKAKYTALVRTEDEVQEIHFGGEALAVDLRQPSTSS